MSVKLTELWDCGKGIVDGKLKYRTAYAVQSRTCGDYLSIPEPASVAPLVSGSMGKGLAHWQECPLLAPIVRFRQRQF